MIRYCECFDSPIGRLTLIADDEGLCACTNDKAEAREHPSPITAEAKRQLLAYFAGERTAFDVPLHLCGTDFQRDVWKQLLMIPYGESRAYSDIAAALGKPNACRAVGNAIGANPLLIFVPCHRILAKGGRLGGFSAGIEHKMTLLHIEKISLKNYVKA